jgi:ATP-dependent exoDNAse (exonuclease V) alpha subunit
MQKQRKEKARMADNIIRCIVKPRQIIFPRGNATASIDNFTIFSAEIIKVKEGSSNISFSRMDEITLKGNAPKLRLNSQYNVVAKEIIDPKWGKQYQVVFMCEEATLDSEIDQKRFLMKILPEATVNALYEVYSNPFEIIEKEDVSSLVKVKGIKLAKALSIIQRFKETIDFSEVYVELDALGLTDLMIKKLCLTYGNPNSVVRAFKTNPYILCKDVDGIGFKRADDMAINYGIEKDSPVRIEAFINYYLEEASVCGRTWVWTKSLMGACVAELALTDNKIIGIVLNGMNLWKSKDMQRVALQKYYNLELDIATEIMRLKTTPNTFKYSGWEEKIKKIEENIGFEYTDEQKDGVKTVLENNVTVLTGLGGTGKAQPLYSKIFTPNGYVEMRDIKVGDKIYGEDGKPHNVVGVYPQGTKNVYEITLSSGDKVRCCEDHLWTYQTKYQEDDGLPYSTQSLKEIMKLKLSDEDENGNITYNIFLPQTQPLCFEERPTQMRPYVFGSLLRETNFELASYEELRLDDYLYNTVEIRVSFLLGLIGFDIDTGILPDNFYTDNDKVAECVKYLVESLGGIAKREEGHLSLNLLDMEMPNFNARRTIREITYVGKEECQCIMTDNPTHLYLTDNLIVTHNTTVTKAMISVLKDNYDFAQTALAGRAARRMTELSGYEAQTIHKLLNWNPRTFTFEYNSTNQLPYEIIIVDESSMIGGQLFYDLLCAIKTGTKLVIVGDYGQLESIGVCNVFHDLLNTKVIPVVKLTKIHRQAQKSAIITDSINVRNNKPIFDSSFTGKEIRGELQDLELDIEKDNQTTLMRILKQYSKQMESVGNDIMRLQVIVPQKERGDISTYRINNAIQAIYNADGDNSIEISLSKDKKYTLREGDKVICVKNNYKTVNLEGDETPIFNGSIGVIRRINLDEKLMVVNFQDIGNVVLSGEFWKTIQLGYAITVHKMQGSSANTVIIGLDYSCYMMLSAEMLYTSISRAEKYCVLVAENKAIQYAIKNTKTDDKTTFLKEFIQILNKKHIEEEQPLPF